MKIINSENIALIEILLSEDDVKLLDEGLYMSDFASGAIANFDYIRVGQQIIIFKETPNER